MDRIFLQLVKIAFLSMSPQLIKECRIFAARMVSKAKSSPNPWDDLIWNFASMIVGKPEDKIPESPNLTGLVLEDDSVS